MGLALPSGLVALALLVALGAVFALVALRLRGGGAEVRFRPLPAVAALRAMSDRAIEEGRGLHVALGTGRISDATAAEALAGLLVVDALAAQASRASQQPVVTTADPASQLLAADALAQGDAARGWQSRTAARFVAPQPAAYGAGTRGTMQRERLGLTAAVGHLGDEYLFVAAEQPNGGQPFHAPELAATARVESLPLLHLTARHPLLGEELFALGAYLDPSPARRAGLLLQDVGRVALGVAIVVGAILRSVGLL